MGKSFVNKECIDYNGAISNTGYGMFWMNNKTIGAHRASYLLNKGEIHDGKWVLHTCDNKKCINPLHLYLGDHKQNTIDAINRGRLATGERHGSKTNPNSFKRSNAVFTDLECISINESNLSVKELSKKYNVHFATIYRAKYRADSLLKELEKEEK